MLDALPKIEGLSAEDQLENVEDVKAEYQRRGLNLRLPEEQLTVQGLKAQTEPRKMDDPEVMAIARRRLLAGRIGEARSFLRIVFPLDRERYVSADEATMVQNGELSDWMYVTALQNGHLETGLMHYEMDRCDMERLGVTIPPLDPALLSRCGYACIQQEDWHNAIASFERAGNMRWLLELAARLEQRGDEEAKNFAAIARRSAEEISKAASSEGSGGEA